MLSFPFGHCPLCVNREKAFIDRGVRDEKQHVSCGKCGSLGGSDAQPLSHPWA